MMDHTIEEDLLRGLAELEYTGRGWLPHRLPAAARAQCADPQLRAAESQPSGVRVVFESAATLIELDVLRTQVILAGVPNRPDGTVDLLVDGALTRQQTTSAGDVVLIDPRTGETTLTPGAAATIRFDGLAAAAKTIEIWLPHHERTELVALRTDAPIRAAATGGRRIWVHHGSSISQGSNAASPSTTWPALAAAAGGVELVNLGLAGSAMLDQFTARAIATRPADLVSVKIGINLVNADVMRQRAFGPAVHGFLDTIRDGHPDIPLVVIGPLDCPIHEITPGPGAFDTEALAAGRLRFLATGDQNQAGALTLVTIREQLAALVQQRSPADPNLFYLDGHRLYGPDDAPAHPLPDNLHPDAETHRLIAARFADWAFPGPFAT